jgi:hypothetical protein
MWKLARKVFVLVVATAMLLGGLYLLVAELFLVHHVFLRIVIAAVFLTGMGSYLLWMDFVGPRFASKAEE